MTTARTIISSETRRYLSLFDALPVHILLIDAGRRIVFLNKTAARYYKAAEGQLCYRAVRGRAAPCHGCRLAPARGGMALCEECVTPRNDTHLVFESRLVDAGGGPVALRLGLDVTGYKKTEFQLSACRQMLQDLIDFLPDLTFAVNTRRKVIAWNHALEQYLGVKASDMIGKGNYSYSYAFYKKHRPIMIDLVFGEKAELNRDYLVIRRDKGVLVAETYIPNLRGGVYLWAKAALIYDENGKVIGAIESLRDITAQKMSEAALRASQKELKAFSARLLQVREEEQKKLANDLHDEVGALAVSLNTYLALSQAEMKAGNYPQAALHAEKVHEVFQQSIVKLKRLATDLRPPDLDLIGLRAVLAKYFSRMFGKTSITVKFSMSMNERYIDGASRIVLYRVAQEAVTNILKHAHARSVSIQVSRMAANIRCRITDNGKGFAAGNKGLLARGFGIRGMRERVEAVGGVFEMYSKPGKGTRITVTLPIKQER